MSIFKTLAEQALTALEQGDIHTGVALLKEGAEKGEANAQYRYGLLHANGQDQGQPLNYVLAASWITKAADQGLAEAQSTLAWLTASGFGVDQSDQKAGELYLRAARGGAAKDQYMAASMYRWGRYGVEADAAEALKWYHLAADQSHAAAQLVLGRLCMDGKLGVVRDDVTAFQWLTLAAVNGNAAAEKLLTELQQRMSTAQLTEAKIRVMGAAGESLG